MKRKHKEYFVYCIKDNIFIFDVFDYIEELAADYVDYAFEWNLVKNNIIIDKNIRIKEYIQLYITDALIKINDKLNKHNCKIVCFFKKKNELNLWSSFFDDPNRFINISKRVLKKRLPNFIETEEKNLFSTIKGLFDGIPCLIPSGEDESFLQSNLKKLL